MSFAWQEILVGLMCCAAAAYVCRRAWLAIAGRGTTGCGAGCAKCGPTKQPELLSLDLPPLKKSNSSRGG